MANIEIERRGRPGWVWIVGALLLLAAVAWWVFARGSDGRGAATAAGTTPAADPGVGAGEASAVARFLAFADSGGAQASAGPDHGYTADGVRRLAGAIAELATRDSIGRDSIGGAATTTQVDALRTLADRLQADAQSLAHADIFRAAATSSAELLGDLQGRRFPTLAADVGPVRDAAAAIAKDRPLLEQKARIDAFFASAARAVRAMQDAS